jgi:DNA-binding transcriptional regulator GbsR (MarR family)
MAEMREPNNLNALKVKVDVDVSDALKGLKALRREVNMTLKAIKKLNAEIQKGIEPEVNRQETEEYMNALVEELKQLKPRRITV